LKLGARRRTSSRALFALREDSRPEADRSAAGRYLEPTLLALIREA